MSEVKFSEAELNVMRRQAEWLQGVVGHRSDAKSSVAYDVARWLLDLLPPADDGEPVTSRWLIAAGGERAGEPIAFPCKVGRLLYFPGDANQYIPAECRLEQGDESVLLLKPRTRGEFRRLCAALEITLSPAT